jgi:hypothetical protein
LEPVTFSVAPEETLLVVGAEARVVVFVLLQLPESRRERSSGSVATKLSKLLTIRAKSLAIYLLSDRGALPV